MSDNNININTPEIGPYTHLQPFRFWCQKVLPLVYDESLSYYELLCKVVDYLNKTMEDVDQMITDMGEFKAADTEFKTEVRDAYIAFSREVSQAVEGLETFVNNYFNNLNVQQEINNKLDAMAAAGYFNTLFTTLFTDDIITEAGNVTSAWVAENLLQETGYVIDNSLTVENAAADAKVTGNAISDVNDALDDIRDITYTDLLQGETPVDDWFIDSATGEGRELNGFYSYENIIIPNNVAILYPYNNYSESNKYIRTICFYDSDDTFISGRAGNASTVNQGVSVPEGATKVSCTLAEAEAGYDGKHYLATTFGGNVTTYPLKENVNINASQIIVDKHLTNNIRKACINFQFDDGNVNDASIVSIFDTYNFKCGFALLSTISAGRVAEYFGYQNKGYEILSHSTDATGMNDATVDPAVIESKLNTSKEVLEQYGFKIKGFVTPSSVMAPTFKPILRKYYQWAETVFGGSYTGIGKPYMKPFDGVYNGKRISLQTTSLANQKLAVDEAIENYGLLTFYGHSEDLDSDDYLTTQNLNELLTYIQTKVSNEKCIVGAPSEVIENYFAPRNDDVSDYWVNLSSSDLQLDARFNINFWDVRYNEKIGLISFNIRVNPTENVVGQLNLVKFPISVVLGSLVQSETGRKCNINDDYLLIQGSDTWTQGTNYRFSAMLKTT